VWTRPALEELFIISPIGGIIGVVIPITLACGVARGYNISLAWGSRCGLHKPRHLLQASRLPVGAAVAMVVLFKAQLYIVDRIVRNPVDAS